MVPRPTLLPDGIATWVDTFAQPLLAPLPEEQQADVYDEVQAALQPAMCDCEGRWFADYVRLRFRATAPLAPPAPAAPPAAPAAAAAPLRPPPPPAPPSAVPPPHPSLGPAIAPPPSIAPSSTAAPQAPSASQPGRLPPPPPSPHVAMTMPAGMQPGPMLSAAIAAAAAGPPPLTPPFPPMAIPTRSTLRYPLNPLRPPTQTSMNPLTLHRHLPLPLPLPLSCPLPLPLLPALRPLRLRCQGRSSLPSPEAGGKWEAKATGERDAHYQGGPRCFHQLVLQHECIATPTNECSH